MTRADAEKALATRLTPEFLATLVEAFRVTGADDLIEVWKFVYDCHRIAGVPCDYNRGPWPYEYDDDHLPPVSHGGEIAPPVE